MRGVWGERERLRTLSVSGAREREKERERERERAYPGNEEQDAIDKVHPGLS